MVEQKVTAALRQAQGPKGAGSLSGRVPGEQGMVLLYPQGRDFTNHVITELNRNQTKAPANKGNQNK